MKQLKKITLSVAAASLLFSCKKNDDSKNNPSVSLVGTWKVTAFDTDKEVPALVSGNPTKDIWAEMPDCYKDNLYIFKAGGEAVFDEGATKCNAGDPQSESGTYTYQHPVLTINDIDNTVLQLDASTLRYSNAGYYYYYNEKTFEEDSIFVSFVMTMKRQ